MVERLVSQSNATLNFALVPDTIRVGVGVEAFPSVSLLSF
jgi:hypothetical protein